MIVAWNRSVAVMLAGAAMLIGESVSWGQEAGIRILVVDAASGEKIPEFRVLAGTPFRRPTPVDGGKIVEISSWQSHTIKSGTSGELTWQTARGYPEMALRVEAEGYIPARQTGTFMGMPFKQASGFAAAPQPPMITP